MDLTDESYNQQITAKLLQEGVNKVLFTDCKRQQNPMIKKEVCFELQNSILPLDKDRKLSSTLSPLVKNFTAVTFCMT